MPEAPCKKIRQNNGSFQYRIFFMVLLYACLVFYSSNLWLPDAQKVMHSADGSVSDSLSDVSLTLVGWEYNPESRYLEASFLVEQKGTSAPQFFSSAAYDIGAPETPLDTTVAYYGSGVLFLHVKDIPKDWKILSFWISDSWISDSCGQQLIEANNTETIEANNQEKSGANFKCDRRKVHQNLSLLPKTEQEYAIKAILNEIDFLKNKIEIAKQSEQKKKEQENKIKEEIVAIRADQTYQTGEEKRESDTVIRQKEQEIEKAKTETAELQGMIQEYKEKISKLNLKTAALQSESE